jgi:hypothetical protein
MTDQIWQPSNHGIVACSDSPLWVLIDACELPQEGVNMLGRSTCWPALRIA